MHRDIKLENILMDGHGNIKIADFGVSKRLKHAQEVLYELCGTQLYLAPELNREKG